MFNSKYPFVGEFKKQQKIKQNFSDKRERTDLGQQSIQNELILILLLFVAILYGIMKESFDVDRTKEKKTSQQSDKKEL